ncbi:MAG: hypothetical protein ACYTEK_24865 [Planctomycetota bacterium]|jgi:hypothetical protein
MDEYPNDPTKISLDGPDAHGAQFKPMTTFDKVCAVLAIPIGIVFMILGAVGLFVGANAHFTLPPILGGLPFFLGWGMSIPLIRYWRISNRHCTGRNPR